MHLDTAPVQPAPVNHLPQAPPNYMDNQSVANAAVRAAPGEQVLGFVTPVQQPGWRWVNARRVPFDYGPLQSPVAMDPAPDFAASPGAGVGAGLKQSSIASPIAARTRSPQRVLFPRPEGDAVLLGPKRWAHERAKSAQQLALSPNDSPPAPSSPLSSLQASLAHDLPGAAYARLIAHLRATGQFSPRAPNGAQRVLFPRPEGDAALFGPKRWAHERANAAGQRIASPPGPPFLSSPPLGSLAARFEANSASAANAPQLANDRNSI